MARSMGSSVAVSRGSDEAEGPSLDDRGGWVEHPAMTSDVPSLDVLIVGAGPTGLFAACDLIRRGLRCRIVEQLEAPQPWSKAQIVHARTLELFERIGVIDAVLKEGKPLDGASIYATPEMKR